ncbi:hypothetical protein OAB57_03745 [Bacteriovoracaceae bacterium]|nr:hypothetical protein [Bacteriovoracaceae bacterium]
MIKYLQLITFLCLVIFVATLNASELDLKSKIEIFNTDLKKVDSFPQFYRDTIKSRLNINGIYAVYKGNDDLYTYKLFCYRKNGTHIARLLVNSKDIKRRGDQQNIRVIISRPIHTSNHSKNELSSFNCHSNSSAVFLVGDMRVFKTQIKTSANPISVKFPNLIQKIKSKIRITIDEDGNSQIVAVDDSKEKIIGTTKSSYRFNKLALTIFRWNQLIRNQKNYLDLIPNRLECNPSLNNRFENTNNVLMLH